MPLEAADAAREWHYSNAMIGIPSNPQPPPWLRDLLGGPVRHRVRDRGEGLTVAAYVGLIAPHVDDAELRDGLSVGGVRRDGEPLAIDDILCAGDSLELDLPLPADDPFLPTPLLPLPVLVDDADLFVVNKPAGLLAYPVGGRRVAALSIAERQLRRGDEVVEVRPLHRLDRETSGILMMARNHRADRRVKKAFQRRKVAKSYLALVRGRMDGGVRIVRLPIGPEDGAIRIRMATRPDGKPAETWLRNLGTFGDPGWTWVEARPRTGRTHQIRVHLAAIGHPIVGDKVYCDDGRAFLRRWEGEYDEEDLRRLELPRHALHAWKTSLRHPDDERDLHLIAPPAPDLLAFAACRGGEPPLPTLPLEVPR